MTRRFCRRAVLAASLALCSVATMAQESWLPFAKPEDAVAYRKGAFHVMERHFSRLNDMVLKKVPYDVSMATEDASAVMLLSHLPFQAFTPGTAAPFAQSRANELVWQANPRFMDSARQFREKADRLPAAVAAGNIDRLRELMVETGAVCRKCHDQFRIR